MSDTVFYQQIFGAYKILTNKFLGFEGFLEAEKGIKKICREGRSIFIFIFLREDGFGVLVRPDFRF